MSNEANECFCMSGMLVNQLITSDVFPLVELSHFSDFRVDIVENLFTDFSEFAFCGIYEAACGVVGEVIFMVF